MTLRLHDTAAREVRDFIPITPGRVSLYLCGATVQAPPHIGHVRSGVDFDILVRWLAASGYQVTFCRNVTDIDDKIIRTAGAEGVPWWAVSERNQRAFTRAYEALGLEHMRAADDIDESAKRDPRDFALWKAAKPGEPAWETPWGPGRPGWHLECSAMATKYLGSTFDIHGGGLDLVFPHHENEIAQSRAAGDGFARYWVHNGLLGLAGEKMSKSLGNSLLVDAMIKEVRPAELRYYLGQAHYRSEMDYSPDALAEAAAAYRRIEGFVTRAADADPAVGAALPGPSAASTRWPSGGPAPAATTASGPWSTRWSPWRCGSARPRASAGTMPPRTASGRRWRTPESRSRTPRAARDGSCADERARRGPAPAGPRRAHEVRQAPPGHRRPR